MHSSDGYTQHRATGNAPSQALCPTGVLFTLVGDGLVLYDAKQKYSLKLRIDTKVTFEDDNVFLKSPRLLFYSIY